MATKELINDSAQDTTSEAKERRLRTNIGEKIIRTLRDACRSTMLGEADVKISGIDAVSDKALEVMGNRSHDEKMKALREMKERWVPELISMSKGLETDFRISLESAKKQGWIGDKSAERWLKRLRNPNVYFYKKKQFIDKTFPSYLKNWEKVSKERKKLLKNPHLSQLTTKDVGKLRDFLDEKAFLDLSFSKREQLTATVNAALLSKEKQIPGLFKKAKQMLERAASQNVLSKSKIGTWLQRIFQSNTPPENIENFLSGKGPMPLDLMIANWTDARRHFDQVEKKREEKGTPRNFHFVKLSVFLNWSYQQRQSYLQEADHRLEDIKGDPPVFDIIKHELASKDWESAGELIEQAEKESLSPDSLGRLKSMKKFLGLHAPVQIRQKGERPAEELMQEMDGLLAQMPPATRQFYAEALEGDYQQFWAFSTLMYNRVWCHQHNFLDEEREKEWEKRADEQTAQRMKEGHSKRGLEANKVDGSTSHFAAIRDQHGVRAAQYVFTDPNSRENRQHILRRVGEEKNNREFWYWTSIIPKGLEYGTHEYIVMTLQPGIKRLAREMQGRGMRYKSPHARTKPTLAGPKAGVRC